MSEEKKEEKSQKESSAAKEDKEATEKKQDENPEELRERFLRLAAEFDNYKKRVAKEIDASKLLGKAELVKKLLPALDEFELAMKTMDGENGSSQKGIELVYANLVGALGQEGLEAMDVKGKFDPYKHEIMLAKESEKGEGVILEVVRKGYMFNGIMLRPASVIVAEVKQNGEQKNKK